MKVTYKPVKITSDHSKYTSGWAILKKFENGECEISMHEDFPTREAARKYAAELRKRDLELDRLVSLAALSNRLSSKNMRVVLTPDPIDVLTVRIVLA